ncbi:MAG: SDR family oxidoreductase [Balneolaceae bacterium]|nr:MAG: SDR family oxidoreductase [Balneolaceae bacterium]
MEKPATVLITGGTSGIGESMVREYHNLGYEVWFTYNTGSDKAAVLEQELGNIRIQSFKLDLTQQGAHDKLVKQLPGTPDILINNAGLGTATVKKMSSDPDEHDRLLIQVNAVGTLWLTRAILAGMRKRNSGRIIFISSVGGGINVYPGFSLADGMSKAAIAFLGRQLAAELVHTGIRVFTVCPGATNTPMFSSSTLDHLDDDAREKVVSGLPGGRLIEPAEIAAITLFLSGKAADVLHGAVIDASLGLGVNPAELKK